MCVKYGDHFCRESDSLFVVDEVACSILAGCDHLLTII